MIAKMEASHEGAVKRRFHAWKNLIESNITHSEQNKLKITNDFFNQFDHFEDADIQGKEDHWDTPEEFIVKRGGDCEDFAISKYFTLIALGIPVEKLRITYVKALKYNKAHMVLTYYSQPESDPLVLDSLTLKIFPASKRTDLLPIYSFNGEGLWLAKTKKRDRLIGGSLGLTKWRDLMNRMTKR